LRDELTASLNQQLKVGIDALRGDLQNSISDQIKTGIAAVQTEVDTRVDSGIDARLANLDGIVATSVAESVATATRDLPERISGEVGTQIDALNIDTMIGTANNALAAQLRAEQAQALADQQARTTAAINNSVTVLRGEISATRSELATAINNRVVVTRPGVSPVSGPIG
jgi:hypothetical protein